MIKIILKNLIIKKKLPLLSKSKSNSSFIETNIKEIDYLEVLIQETTENIYSFYFLIININ